MRRPLALLLVVASLCLGLVATQGVAHADGTDCLLNSGNEPIGTEDDEIDLGPVTVGGSGQQFSICWTYKGNYDWREIPNWAPPRIVPGTCEPSPLYDPLCFSIYADPSSIPRISSFTITTHDLFNGPRSYTFQTVSYDFEGDPWYELNGAPLCVLSIGYPAAPDHNCERWVDLGQ